MLCQWSDLWVKEHFIYRETPVRRIFLDFTFLDTHFGSMQTSSPNPAPSSVNKWHQAGCSFRKGSRWDHRVTKGWKIPLRSAERESSVKIVSLLHSACSELRSQPSHTQRLFLRGTKSHDRTSPWHIHGARLLLAMAATLGKGWQWHKMISIGDCSRARHIC